MHKARYWEKGTRIRCTLCPQGCVISYGKSGLCRARKNEGGVLKSLVYGKAAAVNTDPIEKKPLYHFHPGTTSFSIGTAGCNLSCEHCQNFDISCADPEKVPSMDMPPEKVVELALSKGCTSISYTYNEPSVFFEYAIDCAKLARKKGLANIIVTNGFINEEPASEFAKYMDAANVDLKAFNDDFYKKICNGRLEPVLNTLKIFHGKLWLEITNLIIDGKNDNMNEISEMCCFIRDKLNKKVPIHFSRAHPMYKMLDIIPTPEETLKKAREIAKRYLDYVYIGNTGMESNTYCPKCGGLLISRKYYNIVNKMKRNTCACGQEIAGMF